MNKIFRHEGGRRYLRDTKLPYPLPVDLAEVHRQTLRTVLLVQLWGAPFVNDHFDEDTPPTKVLEVCCGSGLWSSACHDYFKKHGHTGISFTGMDVAPLTPDLAQTGMQWHFVQHDMCTRPWPFPDGEFDFVFIKDASLVDNQSNFQEPSLTETARVLKSGGMAEVWDGDHVVRSLLPHPALPPNVDEDNLEHFRAQSAYVVGPGTSFAPPQNKFLVDANEWIEAALTKRGLRSAPCLIVRLAFEMGGDSFTNVNGQRLALPFSELRWEEETGEMLNEYQLANRETALLTLIGFIEALDISLRPESGKRQDEWDRWVTAMKDDLINKKGTYGGECMELGAWWATKI